MSSVLDEEFQARADAIRSDAAERCIELAAAHLDAMAKLLLRAKVALGFGDVVADDEAFRGAIDEASELVAELPCRLPLGASESVKAFDNRDELGAVLECVANDVQSDIDVAFKNVVRKLIAGVQ